MQVSSDRGPENLDAGGASQDHDMRAHDDFAPWCIILWRAQLGEVGCLSICLTVLKTPINITTLDTSSSFLCPESIDQSTTPTPDQQPPPCLVTSDLSLPLLHPSRPTGKNNSLAAPRPTSRAPHPSRDQKKPTLHPNSTKRSRSLRMSSKDRIKRRSGVTLKCRRGGMVERGRRPRRIRGVRALDRGC